MQQAIALLQGDKRGDYGDGVQLGRKLFAALPENNRIVKRERERWSLENQRDECFADMYVHPQEIDYNIETLFELIDASDLEFIGFSNPSYWQLERLLGKAPKVMEQAKELSDRALYRLIELLDPEVTHYEFFLGRSPLPKADWSSDNTLLAAIQSAILVWTAGLVNVYLTTITKLSSCHNQNLNLSKPAIAMKREQWQKF
jgi:hypothetical protein